MLKPIYKAGLLLTASLFVFFISSSFKVERSAFYAAINPPLVHTKNNAEKEVEASSNCYEAWDLSTSGLSKNAFDLGYKGYELLKQKGSLLKSNLLTVIDFSRSSAKQRLFIIDMLTGKVLLQSLVAHGKNSGNEFATQFSNDSQSHQSSLGFYITRETYNGGHGYLLRLQGCERGINDAAFARDIVIHAADYVSENYIQSKGYIGRSFGCPAVPQQLHKKIIDLVKNGSCLFIYHPTQTYLKKSTLLNG